MKGGLGPKNGSLSPKNETVGPKTGGLKTKTKLWTPKCCFGRNK